MKDLTSRQQQLLQLLSDGCTQKQIGAKMKVSERYVRYLLEKIRLKWECENNEMLIKHCTKAGHIE